MPGYRGFLGVRVQQLTHNYFSLRSFHEEEHHMSDLWEAAQRSREALFVSVVPAEGKLWTRNRDVSFAPRRRPQ